MYKNNSTQQNLNKLQEHNKTVNQLIYEEDNKNWNNRLTNAEKENNIWKNIKKVKNLGTHK